MTSSMGWSRYVQRHVEPPFLQYLQVLAEEASTYVIQLWRQLAFESNAYVAGLETGTMMV